MSEIFESFVYINLHQPQSHVSCSDGSSNLSVRAKEIPLGDHSLLLFSSFIFILRSFSKDYSGRGLIRCLI